MRTPKFPILATIGAILSLPMGFVGFMFLFVSGIHYGIEQAMLFGALLLLIATILLICGLVMIGVYRMLKSALPAPVYPPVMH